MTLLYAYEIVLALSLQVPIIGEIRSTSRSLLFVQHSEEEGIWTHHQELCTIIVQDNIRFTQTTIPQAFIDAIPPKTIPLRREQKGEYTHVSWDTPLHQVGFNSADGVLPSDIDDPRVYDWDKDGRAAATLLIEVPILGVVETYIVQKSDLKYYGSYLSNRAGAVTGAIEFEAIEQKILDATSPIFKHSASAQGIAEESYFTLIPIDAPGCEAALKALYPLSVHSWLE